MKLKEYYHVTPLEHAQREIRELKEDPCRICRYQRGPKKICFAKYVHKGRCPVYKILKAEFEKIGRDEE